MTLVWKNEHWTKAIFDLAPGSVYKYHVEAMFLQLRAANLLSIHVIEGTLKWVVARQNKKCRYPPHNWKLDECWNGVWLQDSKAKRRHNVM